MQEEAPQPLAVRTVALVVIEQAPPTPDAHTQAPSTAASKAPHAIVEPAPQLPQPKLIRANRAPSPRPESKPITADPRMKSFPIPAPVFKAPPRRPALIQPALTKPDRAPKPATDPKSDPTHTTAEPVKMAKVTPVAVSPSAAPLTPPRYGTKGLTNPHPRYPWLARQQGEQGRVVVRVAVDRTGQVINAEIAQSSGHGRLDRAALNTLRRWRFVPARRGTAPVTATVEVPVTFRLSDN
ncbi:MAG: protein TonB [Alphaproteobacteria bacterium]